MCVVVEVEQGYGEGGVGVEFGGGVSGRKEIMRLVFSVFIKEVIFLKKIFSKKFDKSKTRKEKITFQFSLLNTS